MTAEQSAGLRERLATGYSIEESAQILFEGLADDKLYIGPLAFSKLHVDLDELITVRAENILIERNPKFQD
ncbi:MAG: hypothetical protein JSV68_10185 [Anaerolineaceae bacterium]|nr:MAG: hypothetical protein JSV68_10185 [Anaerolineaceae bacterium]